MRNPTIADLFPEGGRLLLTGGGREFIERIGVEAVRHVVLGVLMGENVRTQTEPLTRRRIAQVSGAMVALFTRGLLEVEDFTGRISQLAVDQIETGRRKASIWPAQWLIGLTGKSVQNVLRSNPEARNAYISGIYRHPAGGVTPAGAGVMCPSGPAALTRTPRALRERGVRPSTCTTALRRPALECGDPHSSALRRGHLPARQRAQAA